MWQLIPIAAGAILGGQRAQRQADADKAYNLAQAEITRYSPWTGKSGQLKPQSTTSWLDGALQGGLGGASLAQGLGGFGGGGASAGAAGGSGSYLGGTEMAAQLGKPGSSGWDMMSTGKPNMYANNSGYFGSFNY